MKEISFAELELIAKERGKRVFEVLDEIVQDISYDWLDYKGIKYPTRSLIVLLNGMEQEIRIAPKSLLDIMGDPDDYDTDEEEIDNEIYFYVEDNVMIMDGGIICEKHLDVPILFIEEDEKS